MAPSFPHFLPRGGRKEGGEEKFKWGLRRNYAERREGGRSALKSGGGTLLFFAFPPFRLALSQKSGEKLQAKGWKVAFSFFLLPFPLFSTKSDEDESFLLGVTPPPWLYVLYILLSETMRRSAKWERAPNRICPSSLTLHLLKEEKTCPCRLALKQNAECLQMKKKTCAVPFAALYLFASFGSELR